MTEARPLEIEEISLSPRKSNINSQQQQQQQQPQPQGQQQNATSCFLTLLYEHKKHKKYLPALSVVIILLSSVAIKYLTELELLTTFGLLCPGSWENNPTFAWCCLIVYSVGLVLISFLISSKRFSNQINNNNINGSNTTNNSTSSNTNNNSQSSSNNDGSSIIITTTSNTPNSLTRLRNHLTFLPIIHFIQQKQPYNTVTGGGGGGGEGEGVADGDGISSISFNDPTVHTKDGHDKEYLSKLEFQRDSLVDAILESSIHPWYERISNDKTFPLQSKKILQAFFDRLLQKFQQIDRTNLVKEAIELAHLHWKNYCEAANKVTSPHQSIGQHFKFVHDFIDSREELSKHYETLLCHLLKQFIIPDLQSTVVCQFLSGILVKGFVLYYVDLITDPNWINTSLKKLISSGTSSSAAANFVEQHQHAPPISAGSSQESLFDFPTTAFKNCSKDDSNNSQSNNDDSIKIRNNKDSIDSTAEVFSSDCPSSVAAAAAAHRTDSSSSTSSSSSSDSDLPQESIDAGATTTTTVINKVCTTNDVEEVERTSSGSGSSKTQIGSSSSSKKSLQKKGSNVTSVSAALGGLLSATALPLLPGGSDYTFNLSGCSTLDPHNYDQQNPILEDHSKIINATQTVGDDGEDANSIQSHDDNLNSTTTNITTEKTTITTKKSLHLDNEADKVMVEKIKITTNNEDNPNPATTTPTTTTPSSYRHYSYDDGPKAKTTLCSGERDTKSLDDTKDNCSVTRQEEFDLNFDDDPRKLQLDNSSNRQDISPMYDEAEVDFAATIAKLRSLLEQRESRKNLMENVDSSGGGGGEGGRDCQNLENEADVFKTNNTPPEDEHSSEEQGGVTSSSTSHPQPIKSTNSAADSTRPSLNSQSSASSLGSDVSGGSSNNSRSSHELEKIVDELAETNNPVLNRFFLNVSIPKTETCSDSSSGQFVLYCIQYEGVYVEENDDGQLEKLVLRTTTIKRRFQEFLLLQSQLEESSVWRPHVKGKARIGRSWILSDNTNINQRKLILERYLHQLCYNPVLGFCPQLRKFMAYGEEGFQAFATSDTIPLHRFDKLAKKFTGVFNSLRDALPSFESDLLAIPSSPDAGPGGKSPTDNKAKSLFASFLRAEKLASSSSSSSDSVDECSKPSTENNNACSKTKTESSVTDNNTSSKWENKGTVQDGHTETDDAQFLTGDQKNTTTVSETTLLEEQLVDGVYPLALAATNLLCDVLWLPQHRPHTASVSTFLRISGKSFENYLQDMLEHFLSKGSLLTYLDAVTVAIKDWNTCDELNTFEKEIQYSETDLKNCLKQKIPVWVCWMWGRSRVDNTIDRLTKVCQTAVLNQELVLSLIELLFSKLIIDNVTKVETNGDK